MNLIIGIVVAWIFYELGAEREEKAIALNSPGAVAARAAGAKPFAAPNAAAPPPGSSVDIVTGDIKPSSTTP